MGDSLRDYTQFRHGTITFLRRGPDDENGRRQWKFVCDCGSVGVRRAKAIPTSKKSCGCVKRKHAVASSRLKDWTGVRQGKIVVVARGPDCKNGSGLGTQWEVMCDCGGNRLVRGSCLARGQRSCGCEKNKYFGEGAKIKGACTGNGRKMTPTYRTWDGMKNRCHNERSSDYPRYGERGTRVCDRWYADFAAFLADMGERPKGMTIDRENTFGSYTCGRHDLCADCREKNAPANCRWATPVQQGRNSRDNVRLTVDGETLCAAEWAERCSDNPRRALNTLYRMFHKGIPHADIIAALRARSGR